MRHVPFVQSKPWAVHFASGDLHRYTDAQMLQKFGVTEVIDNQIVEHPWRGPGIVCQHSEEMGSSAEQVILPRVLQYS